jgi:hypothetical protein
VPIWWFNLPARTGMGIQSAGEGVKGIKQGKDKVTALKDAKNYLRNKRNGNPFYRVPFILIGEAY